LKSADACVAPLQRSISDGLGSGPHYHHFQALNKHADDFSFFVFPDTDRHWIVHILKVFSFFFCAEWCDRLLL
jgi:hypothetical protein